LYSKKVKKAHELFKSYDLYVEYIERGWARVTKSNKEITENILKLKLSQKDYSNLFNLICETHSDMGRPDSKYLLKDVFASSFSVIL